MRVLEVALYIWTPEEPVHGAVPLRRPGDCVDWNILACHVSKTISGEQRWAEAGDEFEASSEVFWMSSRFIARAGDGRKSTVNVV